MNKLARTIYDQLLQHADAAKAPGMQAYMKSTMPYLGVSAVPLDRLCKRVYGELSYSSSASWHADVMAIWNGAQFREERYAAIELTGARAARDFQRMDALGMYEHMIASGAWWDYVDAIATLRLRSILRNEPGPMKRETLRWSKCDNMWKRRSSILCQLKAKKQTDLRLLYACIEPSIESKEFFLRKAIGWALREYAKTDAAEVMRYVKANEGRMSGLSKREALKNN